jgi:Immunoglobulin domain
LHEVNELILHRVVLLLISCTIAFGLTACGGMSGTVPTITAQPQNQSVPEGSMATFSVTATGSTPLNYQWMKNGMAISGANSASYTMPATALSDNNTTFAVVVSNNSGSVTSNTATLTVLAVP